jgi:NADH:ubiquinone oxidoreductase subunit 4 (subunit M)
MTLNFYAHVYGNPLGLADPAGTSVCDEACLEDMNRQRQDFVKKLLERLKDAPSMIGAFAQDFIKSLESMPAAAAAQISAWAGAVLSTLSLGALVAGQDDLAAALAYVSIAATGASWYFTARMNSQGQVPPMAYFISQAFNIANAFLTAGGIPARQITRPGMSTAASLAAASAFLARPFAWGGVPLAYFRWR